ncbi:Rv3654c family TadE-like protein [Leifsonia xyli]|uniref:Rv3654c family TadE-like protein n=1 Tax=Leifsonia xyli TaxID=1575 RepID=UPI003D679914
MRVRWADDRGAGSVLALGVLGAVVTVTGGAIAVIGATAAHARAAAAADLAALAAADAAAGRISAIPCEAASDVAQANGAAIAECAEEGAVVTVTTVTPYLGLRASASARAGPPPGGG